MMTGSSPYDRESDKECNWPLHTAGAGAADSDVIKNVNHLGMRTLCIYQATSTDMIVEDLSDVFVMGIHVSKDGQLKALLCYSHPFSHSELGVLSHHREELSQTLQ